MNPYLERYWPDVHTSLIGYIRDTLAEQLPVDLNARAEERVTLTDPDNEHEGQARPDVAVIESWRRGIPPTWQPGTEREGGLKATEPQIVICDPETERWVQISDRHGRVITVIEVLSPANKDEGRGAYRAKRRAYLNGGVNVVEIDLLRGGWHVLATPLEDLHLPAGAYYLSCVTRALQPERKEMYVTPLASPLPSLAIPLRPHEQDAVLALQPLLDRCHRMGSYWNADYTRMPGPPLPAEDAAWVAGQIQQAGLGAA